MWWILCYFYPHKWQALGLIELPEDQTGFSFVEECIRCGGQRWS